MSDLADRMKDYERAHRTTLPPRAWTVVRLDGRAFHTWTQGLERPFSSRLVDAMGIGMLEVCKELAGTVIGYGQSDEVSLVLSDFGRADTQAFHDGQVQKLVSVSASIITAHFARQFPDRNPAMFDARVFALPNRDEVRNYLLWRQQDARRNAIGMIASAYFSHEQLHGVPVAQRRIMLEDVGVDISALDARFLNGQTCHRELRLSDVTYTDKHGVEHHVTGVERWAWETQAAPTLDCQPDTFLDRILPGDPEA
jgi:tRNA(His) 5'-end guanylyltransferase